MYKYRSVHNDDFLGKVHYKLQKRIDLIESVNDKFDRIDSFGGERSETLTLGTDDNLDTLLKAGIIPAAPLAIGIGAVALGLVVLLPTAFPDPDLTRAELEVVDQIQNAGGSILEFSGKAFGAAIKLSAIPAVVAAISIPKKVARILADKFDEKTHATLVDSQLIVDLIDKVNEDSDDPSIEFAKKFLYRVDISGNSKDFNMELLSHLAYHRYCFQKEEKGENKNGELNEAFENFIYFLEESQHKLIGVSRKFKDNKLVNELISEFYDKKYPVYNDDYVPGESVRRV